MDCQTCARVADTPSFSRPVWVAAPTVRRASPPARAGAIRLRAPEAVADPARAAGRVGPEARRPAVWRARREEPALRVERARAERASRAWASTPAAARAVPAALQSG